MARKTTVRFGQKASPLDLGIEDLNTKERKVLGYFSPKGPRGLYTLEQLSMVFRGQAKNRLQAGHWTRAQLRRLVRGRFVEHASRGTYRLTIRARKLLPQVSRRAAA
jgi:hypothetical protein